MLLSNLNLLATAPDGVAKLRELILTLAVQGKLVPQDAGDEPASVLLKKIRAEKGRLIAEGKIKRDKPLGEIAEEDEPFALPVGWEWVRLNALLQKIGAGSTPLGGREVYTPTGVKFLRSQNVWDDGLRLVGVAFIKPETHAKMSGTTVLPDDLLFNITGASIGRCAVVPSDFDEANVSQHVTIVRAVLPALNAFLHKVLVSRHVQQTVMDVQVGVSREGLSIAKLGNFLIPLPPLAEQCRIVTRVEELMRLCDALEAKARLETTQHEQLVRTLLSALTTSTTPEELADNWNRVATHFDLLLDRPEAVDALEQTILQLAVRGLLVPQDPQDEPASELLKKIRAEKDRLIAEGKIKRDKPLPPIAEDEKPFDLPLGWEWARMGEIGFTNIGLTYTPNNVAETGTPVLRSNNVQAGKLDLTDLKRVNIKVKESVLVAEGDLLICARNGSKALVGKTAQITGLTEPMAFGAFMAIFRSEVNGYVLHFINSPQFRRMISEVNTTTINQITQENLKSTVLPLPPLAEQSRIVARVASLRALCADLRLRLTTARAQQALLAEVLVQQPTD